MEIKFLSCVWTGDEEGTENEAGSASDAGNADQTFTQDQLNRILADDRRKHQQKYSALEKQMQSLAEDKNLEQQQREELQASLEEIQAQRRTKEQQIAHDAQKAKREYEERLKKAEEDAKNFRTMYEDTVVTNALMMAADPEEVTNRDLIVRLLKPQTAIRDITDEDGKPTGQKAPLVELEDVDVTTGKRITTLRTPEDALARMKELPTQYGGLFRANVVSGIGSGTATDGVKSGSGDGLDLSEIAKDPALYRKYRKENPAALGLRPKS
jgi:hypothetical protein